MTEHERAMRRADSLFVRFVTEQIAEAITRGAADGASEAELKVKATDIRDRLLGDWQHLRPMVKIQVEGFSATTH